MAFELFQEVVLTINIPDKGLRQGDVATVVAHHPRADAEDGYSLEVFNALGETVAVVTVGESAIEALSADEVFTVRSFSAVS